MLVVSPASVMITSGPAPVRALPPHRLRTQHHRIVKRSPHIRAGSTRRTAASSTFGSSRKIAQLNHIAGKRKYRQPVAGPYHFLHKMSRGIALDFQLDRRRAAGIHHQRQIERTIRLRLEAHNLLLHTFFEKLKCALRQADHRLAFGIRHARQNAHQIRLDANRSLFAFACLAAAGGLATVIG